MDYITENFSPLEAAEIEEKVTKLGCTFAKKCLIIFVSYLGRLVYPLSAELEERFTGKQEYITATGCRTKSKIHRKISQLPKGVWNACEVGKWNSKFIATFGREFTGVERRTHSHYVRTNIFKFWKPGRTRVLQS